MELLLNYLYTNWHLLHPNFKLIEVAGENFLFGRYKAQAVVGIGGTSIVISAHDNVLNRLVAIKIWNPETGNFRQFIRGTNTARVQKAIDYFQHEAQLLASLKHENLCQIYDFGIADGIPWLVMELFEGLPLRALLGKWISDSRQHTATNVFTILKQVVIAVDFLHKRGLYQLDIKPENILVNDNFVKLIDIASGLEKPSPDFKTRAVRYGTPGYVAPEVISSNAEAMFSGGQTRNPISPASDVFSLGVTFLEMYCLQNPLLSGELQQSAYQALQIVQTDTFSDYSTALSFPDEDDDNVIQWSEKYTNELSGIDTRLLLQAVSLPIPHELIELIAKMMSLKQSDRPRNAGEILKALVRIESIVGQNETTKMGINPVNNKNVVLFLAADPTDATRLRLGEEYREIQEKLQLAKMREKFNLTQRFSVRPADISQSILDEKPQIVHYSGHGTIDGYLCFENELGQIHYIEPDALAELFELVASHVECVLLNACYSTTQAEAIAKHIKYVVGMNKAIGDKAAIAFAVGFYQALGAGKSYEEAYKFGCVQIRLQGIPEHLTPVLYSSANL